MSLVFWRSVNGYMYPSNLGAPNGAGTTTAYYPYLSAGAPGTGHHAATAGPATAPAGPCQALAPLSGAGPTTIPSALALAAAAAGTPAAATPAHKWMMPGYMSSQQMYMFLPKMSKPKTERVNKAVKCEICNLTLNSELQAQQHYNGKNHLKKMKQLGMPLPGEDEGKKVIQQYTSEANSEGNEDSSQGDAPELGQGNQSEETDCSQQESIEDTSESPPSGPQAQLTPSEGDPTQQEQQQLDQQQQLQQQHQTGTTTSTSTITTEQQQQQQQQQKLDPVSQAVYDNILGKLPRKRKMEIPCCVCDMIFNSEAQASQHFRGVKHAKRLKMSEDFKTSPPKSCSDGEASPDGTSPSDSKSSSFFCHYCGVALNSTQQLEEHREGQLHKKMVERKSGSGSQTRRASDDGLGCQSGMMHCKVCDIRVPSPSKFQQHLSSSEHAERMQGRPLVDEAPDSPGSSSSSSTNQHQQC